VFAVNRTRGTFLGVDIKRADNLGARLIGLYRHRNLSLGDGVWLVPCNNIQTVGMRHSIDVIFLNREHRVVRIYPSLKPGRIIWWVAKARSALEVPAGAVDSSETRVGDRIEFAESLPDGLVEASAGRVGVMTSR
jgi:uncharacterized protein